jgi:hypothetical protein
MIFWEVSPLFQLRFQDWTNPDEPTLKVYPLFPLRLDEPTLESMPLVSAEASED